MDVIQSGCVTKKRSPRRLRGLKAMSAMRMSQHLANQRMANGEMVTGCRTIFVAARRTGSPIGVEAISGGVQGAGQVTGDGGQAVVYLADLDLDVLQVLMGLDASQGRLLFVGVGADVLPLAGAKPALSKVEGSWVGWMR
jgi:hypothetical protein